MRILGVSAYFHDSGAALVEDGELVAAAEEERFTRKKHDFDFPHRAIEFCLQHMGTARLQTIQRETNPLYHQFIERFGTLTGVPVLLNTSFSVKGEVIVDTPQQAVATFLNSGMDSLVMGRPAHESPQSPLAVGANSKLGRRDHSLAAC